jgi:dTDP-4-dehydrorhamnose 3,5-epimerase
MFLEETPIKGLFTLRRKIHQDARGIFSRLYSEDEIIGHNAGAKPVHINSSISNKVGTLRGIHFQYPPYHEVKIVSCVAGAVWDVGVDLRPNSPTRFKWFGIELTPTNGMGLLIPQGFGHAFITLKPNSVLVYAVSQRYNLASEDGIRFDDPIIGIKWPITPRVVSNKDATWEPFEGRIEEFTSKFCIS